MIRPPSEPTGKQDGSKMFALTELVDNPADVTFTSHADLDMGDDIEFEFRLD